MAKEGVQDSSVSKLFEKQIRCLVSILYTPHRLILRNCAPKVCRSDLRIATVGNRWELLLPPAKLARHFLALRACLKSAVCRVRTAHQPLIAPEEIKPLIKERDRDLEGV